MDPKALRVEGKYRRAYVRELRPFGDFTTGILEISGYDPDVDQPEFRGPQQSKVNSVAQFIFTCRIRIVVIATISEW